MDAAGILKSHGWRGTGHSLDTSNRGLVKPLLVSHKQDLLGLGKKKNLVSDQWWMRAFDESLRELGTGKTTTLQQVGKTGIARGGLYGFFVKGETLGGTIHETEAIVVPAVLPTPSTCSSSAAVSGASTRATEDSSEPITKPKPKKRRAETEMHLTSTSSSKSKKRKTDPLPTSDLNKASYIAKLHTIRFKIAASDASRKKLSLAAQISHMGWSSSNTPAANPISIKAEYKRLKRAKRKADAEDRTVEDVLARDEKDVILSDADLASLGDQKAAQYRMRALAKGLSLAAYIAQRRMKRGGRVKENGAKVTKVEKGMAKSKQKVRKASS